MDISIVNCLFINYRHNADISDEFYHWIKIYISILSILFYVFYPVPYIKLALADIISRVYAYIIAIYKRSFCKFVNIMI